MAKYLSNVKNSEWKSNRSPDSDTSYTCFDFSARGEDRQITDGCCFCMDIRIPAIPTVEVKTRVIIMSDPSPALAP